MATPSGKHVNWSPVAWMGSAVGSTSITLVSVTKIGLNPNGSLIKFSGDADRGPSVVVNDFIDSMITVETSKLTQLQMLGPGSRGSLTATHQDARGTVVGGPGYVMTAANCVIGDNAFEGQHRQFGSGSLTMAVEWPDGVTNPITFAGS